MIAEARLVTEEESLPLPDVLRGFFFGTSGFELFPYGFGQQAQVVEFSRAAQPLRAINHYTLAVDVFGHLAEQKNREIAELVVLAEAAHGVFVDGVIFKLLRRDEARPSALGGKRTGGDGVDADVVLGPLDREGRGEGKDAGLGAGGRNHVTRAAIRGSVGGGDIQDIAAQLFGNAAASEGLGAVKCAIKNDADDG